MNLRAWSVSLLLVSVANLQAVLPGWPEEIQEIKYRSAADDTDQPALYFAPSTKEARPLLVGLHSWSSDYRQANTSYGQWAVNHDWHFIHPNFRGRNRTPSSMGSELAVQDILSAVSWARQQGNVDPNRIYVIGASGGGYASLLMAGRAPELWAGVSAWVPISDLVKWHAETAARKLRYAGEIEAALGGHKPVPGTPAHADALKRSAITYMARARGVNLDINAGITDGHNGSVPISHSLEAFNALAAPRDQLSSALIGEFVKTAKVPAALRKETAVDASYGRKTVLFRRKSGAARVTIFQGGHEIIPEAGLQWLAEQNRIRAPKNE
ncbi:MAG: alpha/beta hydrolase family protein [Limisphaerales bacterium]